MGLFRGFKEKLRYFSSETYAGNPSLATPELGKRILDTLSDMAADSLSDLWQEKLPKKELKSPLWPVRHLFLCEWLGTALERLAGYKQRVF